MQDWVITEKKLELNGSDVYTVNSQEVKSTLLSRASPGVFASGASGRNEVLLSSCYGYGLSIAHRYYTVYKNCRVTHVSCDEQN